MQEMMIQNALISAAIVENPSIFAAAEYSVPPHPPILLG